MIRSRWAISRFRIALFRPLLFPPLLNLSRDLLMLLGHLRACSHRLFARARCHSGDPSRRFSRSSSVNIGYPLEEEVARSACRGNGRCPAMSWGRGHVAELVGIEGGVVS